MAQFPVTDQRGIIDGLNYTMSGVQGLGQDFAGFNSSVYADATGNFRPPFAIDNFGLGDPPPPNFGFYVAPITLGTSQMLDERTWRYTFAVAQMAPPFINGQPVTIAGVANSYYDGTFNLIGVIECTTTYVTLRTDASYPIVANSTGGTASLNVMNTELSTDCNAKVTVTGGLQRVILNAQLNNYLTVDPAITPGQFFYTVELNRYKAFPTNDPTNPEFRFVIDANVARKTYVLDTASPSFPSSVETLFIGIVDEPGLGLPDYKGGYYWYIVDVKYIYDGTPASTPIVTGSQFGLRSFSAQVLKP